ncbi:MAG: formate dehydrogenase [Hyphomicrobiaceae bacterium]
MKPSDKKVDSGRRNFLTLAGAGAVAGSAVIASGGKTAEAAPIVQEGEKLYRETDHVRRVYELSRF